MNFLTQFYFDLPEVYTIFFVAHLLLQKKINMHYYLLFPFFYALLQTSSYIFLDPLIPESIWAIWHLIRGVILMILVIKVTDWNRKRYVMITVLFLFWTIIVQILIAAVALLVQMIFGIEPSDPIFFDYLIYLFYFAMLMMTFLFRKLLWKIVRYINNITLEREKKILFKYRFQIFLFVIFICMTISMMKTFNRQTWATQFYFLLGASLVVLNWIFIVQEMKKEKILLINQMQANYQESYKEIAEDVKVFWHSYANVMQTFSYLVDKHEDTIPELKQLKNEFSAWDSKHDIKGKIEVLEINNLLLAGIMSNKLKYAQSLGVRLNCVFTGDALISFDLKELTEIIAAVVDNAIEVAHFSDLVVTTNASLDRDMFTFVIHNTYKLDGEKILKYGSSNNIGLKRIDDIISQKKNTSYEQIDTGYDYTFKLAIKNSI